MIRTTSNKIIDSIKRYLFFVSTSQNLSICFIKMNSIFYIATARTCPLGQVSRIMYLSYTGSYLLRQADKRHCRVHRHRDFNDVTRSDMCGRFAGRIKHWFFKAFVNCDDETRHIILPVETICLRGLQILKSSGILHSNDLEENCWRRSPVHPVSS